MKWKYVQCEIPELDCDVLIKHKSIKKFLIAKLITRDGRYFWSDFPNEYNLHDVIQWMEFPPPNRDIIDMMDKAFVAGRSKMSWEQFLIDEQLI